MNFYTRCGATAFLALLLGTLTLGQRADLTSDASTANPATPDPPAPADQGWHVDVAPYLWFAGINGTVGARGHDSSVHVSAGDVLKYFNFGLMGAVEARYKRIIIPVDFMWVRLKDNNGIPITDDVESVHVKINEDIFTPKIGYRIVDSPRFKTDALFGLRYWHFGTTVTLQPTEVAGGYYGAVNWADAVAGGRFQAFLTPKVVLTIAGDAGGGGSGTTLDYQVVGLLGYKFKKFTVQGGWRYLVIHRRPSDTAFLDMGMTGLALAVVIPLK